MDAGSARPCGRGVRWAAWALAAAVLLSALAAEAEAEARALPSEVTKPRWDVGEVFRDCPGCPEMVVVSSGSFMMGSPESEAGPGCGRARCRP